MSIRKEKLRFAGSAWKLFAGVFVVFITIAYAQAPKVTVKNAWTRPPLPPQNNIAVFMTIDNPGPTARSVVSVSTPDAGKAELHEAQMEGNMMKMAPIKTLRIPPNGSVELKPGSFHIMCFGLKRPLKPGDTFSMVLTLDDGKKIPVAVSVRPAQNSSGADSSMGDHQSPMSGDHP
ncbi:MAG TPA: copper chaperone PCu(A)C [Verrucomicrobiae bacterium]|nr:copper chaperone PCu(A)C [Verrucomicrobiae bacterium]